MYQPKISIITVVYNRVHTIEQLLASVIDQTYPNIEFIIIDGGSTDGTVDLIKKYESSIAKWVSEPDSGIYNAMNKGIAFATGDYIEIIGSDDAMIGKDAIANIIPELEDKPDILSCTEYMVYPKEKRQKIYSNMEPRNKLTYKGGMVGHAAMFAKRELFDKYPFDEKYRIVSDYKFFLQCYFDENVRIKYIDTPVVFFETGNEGASANIEACWAEDDMVYQELNLPFNDAKRTKNERPYYKRLIIMLMNFFGITDRIRYIKNMYLSCKKHTCKNRICRWCGRYGDREI